MGGFYLAQLIKEQQIAFYVIITVPCGEKSTNQPNSITQRKELESFPKYKVQDSLLIL